MRRGCFPHMVASLLLGAGSAAVRLLASHIENALIASPPEAGVAISANHLRAGIARAGGGAGATRAARPATEAEGAGLEAD